MKNIVIIILFLTPNIIYSQTFYSRYKLQLNAGLTTSIPFDFERKTNSKYFNSTPLYRPVIGVIYKNKFIKNCDYSIGLRYREVGYGLKNYKLPIEYIRINNIQNVISTSIEVPLALHFQIKNNDLIASVGMSYFIRDFLVMVNNTKYLYSNVIDSFYYEMSGNFYPVEKKSFDLNLAITCAFSELWEVNLTYSQTFLKTTASDYWIFVSDGNSKCELLYSLNPLLALIDLSVNLNLNNIKRNNK